MMPWKVSWRVIVDGVDMSDRMNPYLMSIEVNDQDGTASDTASLTFDDADGQVRLPSDGARVVIWLQGVKVFEGTVDVVRSSGGRGQGRVLTVSCAGADTRGRLKQALDFHKDDATLEDFLTDAAKRAGLSGITVDPALSSIRRPFWSASGEHLMHLGERLARELGGTFKVRGDTAVLAKRGDGSSPAGGAMPTVRAAWGDNLLSWEISPFRGRPRFTQAKVRWFDRKAAKYREKDVEIEGRSGAPDALAIPGFTTADEDTAKDVGEGRKSASEREGGEGTVRILLDPTARAEGTLTLSGTRPGVDGTYRISGASHRVDRGGGSETTLTVKQPQGDAGKDERSAG